MKWTKQPGPWPLVWRHHRPTRSAALKYEVSLKRDKDTPRFYTRTGLTPLAPIATHSRDNVVPGPTEASAD